MAKKVVATEDEWREMAAEAWDLYTRLGKLMIKSSQFLPLTGANKLERSMKYLAQWNSYAQEEMIKRGGPTDPAIFHHAPRKSKTR